MAPAANFKFTVMTDYVKIIELQYVSVMNRQC